MYTRGLYILLLGWAVWAGCQSAETEETVAIPPPMTESMAVEITGDKQPGTIETCIVTPTVVVEYAKTMLGTPYLYASTDPAKGFDCSGFITYVFNHFEIKVPRSSIDFTDEGRQIPEAQARPGDLILFTGTDSTIRKVGHMGIIVSNTEKGIEFIHSSSGKAKGVVITPLERYYRSRFVKVIRIFPDTYFS